MLQEIINPKCFDFTEAQNINILVSQKRLSKRKEETKEEMKKKDETI